MRSPGHFPEAEVAAVSLPARIGAEHEQIGFGLQIHHRPVEIGAKEQDVRRGDVWLRILRQRRGCTAENRNEAEADETEGTVEQIGPRARGLRGSHQARRRVEVTSGDYTRPLTLPT